MITPVGNPSRSLRRVAGISQACAGPLGWLHFTFPCGAGVPFRPQPPPSPPCRAYKCQRRSGKRAGPREVRGFQGFERGMKGVCWWRSGRQCFACSIVVLLFFWGGGVCQPRSFAQQSASPFISHASNEQSPRPLRGTTYQREHHAICTSKTRIPAIFTHTMTHR